MFGQETKLALQHEILKENHETLLKDYECLQERLKHVEETYELFKFQLQRKSKELEVKNANLLEDCVKERNEKERYKKMFEEMKKTMDDKRNAEVDALRNINRELLLANKKEEEELEKMEKKYVELAEKFSVVEAECAHLYEVEVAAAASGTPSAVMSGIGETENLICQGENEVNHNANNDAIVVSDESDAENENPPRESNISSHRSVENPPRESNISSHQSADINQEEQLRNIAANASNENRASGEIFTPKSTNHQQAFTAPSSSSPSSSSSSDSYEVTVKLPPNWPDWGKGLKNGSNKS